MLTSKVISKSEESKISFPGLFKHKDFGYVVLAWGERIGVVVVGTPETLINYNTYKVGYCSSEWAKFTDKSTWEYITKPTTIEFKP